MLLCRYLAEQMVEHPEREDCYIARLLVKKVGPEDSRRFYLDVENAHGIDRYSVGLTVKGMGERNRRILSSVFIQHFPCPRVGNAKNNSVATTCQVLF